MQKMPALLFDFSLEDDDFENMTKPHQAKNIQLNTLWTVNAFTAWVKAYNKSKEDEQRCPEDLLTTGSKSAVAQWLGRIVLNRIGCTFNGCSFTFNIVQHTYSARSLERVDMNELLLDLFSYVGPCIIWQMLCMPKW